jgi:hypothetical protein
VDTTHQIPVTVARSRLLGWLEENGLLAILVATVAIVICTAAAPLLVGGDLWLTLVGGREVVEHGFPRRDELTVFAAGREWINQQWLAHVLFYGAEAVGGLALLSVLGAVVVTGTFGAAMVAARWRGGTQRATLLVGVVVLLAVPWSWSIRAQLVALPLYLAVVWLLVDARDGVTRRTFWVVPLVAVWANAHGSAVLGATLAVLLTTTLLVRRRPPLTGATALAVLAVAAVLVTPFNPTDTIGYYHLMLVDPPFADLVTEWRRTPLTWWTIPFWGLAASSVGLAIFSRRVLGPFELAALALTLVGAASAVRGVVWFALLACVCIPVTMGDRGWLRDRSVQRRPTRVVLLAVGTAAAVALVALVARGGGWLESRWPTDALPALRATTADGTSTVYPTDRTADWLLWHIPSLRGRIAYDVRFELLERDEVLQIAKYNSMTGVEWKGIADPYDVVVVGYPKRNRHLDAFRREGGRRVVYTDDLAAIVVRERGPG